jgi:hypothetical protein
MRMESIQFVQMSLQELHNLWRKRALSTLITEVYEVRLFANLIRTLNDY